MSCNSGTIISGNWNVLRYPHPPCTNRIDSSQTGKVIRIQNAGRWIFQIQKLFSFFIGSPCIPVRRLTYILNWNINSQFFTCQVKRGKSALCNSRISPMYVCNLSMPHAIYIMHQIFHSFNVIWNNCTSVMKKVIDSHYRYIASYQFLYFRIIKVNTCDHYSVKSPVPAVLQIRHSSLPRLAAVNKCNVIFLFLYGAFKAVKYISKIIVGEPAHGFVYKKHSQIVSPVCL